MPPCHCRSVHVAMRRALLFLQCYELLCKGAIWILSFRVCDADVAPSTVQCCCVRGAQLELGLECAGGELGTKSGARRGADCGESGLGVRTSCTVDRMPCELQELQPQCCREEKCIPSL